MPKSPLAKESTQSRDFSQGTVLHTLEISCNSCRFAGSTLGTKLRKPLAG